MLLIRKILITITIFVLFQNTFANNSQPKDMVLAIDSVRGLNQVIEDIKTKIQVPVVFPKYVPKPTTKYFAHADLTPQKNSTNYFINVDATKDCNGAKYCNIGYVRAEKNQPYKLPRPK